MGVNIKNESIIVTVRKGTRVVMSILHNLETRIIEIKVVTRGRTMRKSWIRI